MPVRIDEIKRVCFFDSVEEDLHEEESSRNFDRPGNIKARSLKHFSTVNWEQYSLFFDQFHAPVLSALPAVSQIVQT